MKTVQCLQNEIIIEIKECEFEKATGDCQYYDGFLIKTNKQTIKIGISNDQHCCERFGCIITNDDSSDFVGSELKTITIIDNELNYQELTELESLDEGGAMFVNLETTNGTLQFVAYNQHEGYYGHDAVLVSKEVAVINEL